MTTTIENHVNEYEKDSLNSQVIKKFRDMNSREFAQYLIDGGNNQKEIEHYLTRIVDQNYANQVLERVTEELWFNQDKLREIRKSTLKFFYHSN